jgi:mono/diheme cytochrome c family protein
LSNTGDQRFVVFHEEGDAATEQKPAEEPTAQDPSAAAQSEKPNEQATAQAEVTAVPNPESPADPVPPAAPAAPVDPIASLNFLKKIPLDPTDSTMKLGKQKFETYCSACHGFAGNGDGLVSLRATALNQGDWLQPTSLHDPKVVAQPVGQIFHTITHGKGKMGSYGTVLAPSERWAVVLYVRALQRANNAKSEDVPRDLRGSIKQPESNN